MKKINCILIYFVFGAFSFWLTDLLINLTIRHVSERIWIIATLICSPMITIYLFLHFKKKSWFVSMVKTAPFVMILGIWLLAPPFIALSQLPYGGSFFDSEFLHSWVTAPVSSTFIMSTYGGSLGGLLLVTIGLIVIGIRNLELIKLLTKVSS